MSWITDNKGEGPWPFTKQPDKWGYLNNPRWSLIPTTPSNYTGRESSEPQVWDAEQRPHITLSSSMHQPCGHWHVVPKSKSRDLATSGHINYTSQGMVTDEEQSLTYTDSDGNTSSTLPDGWTWVVTEGGGTVDQEGNYTAPSNNPSCKQNPTIGVVNSTGVIVSFVRLAVNADWASTNAAYRKIEPYLCYIDPGWGYSCRFKTNHYNCAGTLWMSETSNIGHSANCEECYGVTMGTVTDERTNEAILAGCCVVELMN